MKKRPAGLLSVSLLVAAALLSACKKEGSSGSGALDASDKALFQYLPSGGVGVIGGNYMKLQNFMQSGLGQLTSALVDKMGPGMSTWNTCFSELPEMKKMKVAGSLSLAGKDFQLRLVLSGASIDDIAGCAQKANFKTTVDPDHKFIAIEIPQPVSTVSYLVLPSGAVYSRQELALAKAATTGATRAELEGDIAALGKNTAADDAAMNALIEKVDRSKTVWFVGHGDGTPLADKLGNMWGSFDISGGLAVDVTVQLKVADDAKKAEEGFDQLHQSADQLPGDLKDVVKAMKFTRSGNDVHLVAKVSDAQLKNIVGQFGGMLGAGMRGGM